MQSEQRRGGRTAADQVGEQVAPRALRCHSNRTSAVTSDSKTALETEQRILRTNLITEKRFKTVLEICMVMLRFRLRRYQGHEQQRTEQW